MEISHAIKYAGVDDTDLDLFENQYPLTHGMAYNSYIILDDKNRNHRYRRYTVW